MTFATETRPIFEWKIRTLEVSEYPNITVYWVFRFNNGDIEDITGSAHEATNSYGFNTPDDFFTEERIGELTHQFILKDSAGIPILTTYPIKDKLLKVGVTLTESGI